MTRVIDDDAKAMPLVMEICQTTMGQSIWLLRKLREETPKWWDAIDPEDYTTWVDAIVWHFGATQDKQRKLVSRYQGRSFRTSDCCTYDCAVPFELDTDPLKGLQPAMNTPPMPPVTPPKGPPNTIIKEYQETASSPKESE